MVKENTKADPDAAPKGHDRNADVKPLVLNRNKIDPFLLIQEGKGTARDRDRAILALAEKHDRMYGAATDSFEQLSTEIAWLHRPWYRRWFRKSPMQKHDKD